MQTRVGVDQSEVVLQTTVPTGTGIAELGLETSTAREVAGRLGTWVLAWDGATVLGLAAICG